MVPGPSAFLANHVWLFAAEGDLQSVSSAFAQPFVPYTTPDAWTALNTESTYDWEAPRLVLSIDLTAARLITIAKQHTSLTAGIRY
jgi:hypothetical protein